MKKLITIKHTQVFEVIVPEDYPIDSDMFYERGINWAAFDKRTESLLEYSDQKIHANDCHVNVSELEAVLDQP